MVKGSSVMPTVHHLSSPAWECQESRSATLRMRGMHGPHRKWGKSMVSTPIHATVEIIIRLPAADVWPVVADFGGYSRWWPKSVRVRALSSDAPLLGSEVEIQPRGGRPFRCRVDAVDEPKRIRMRYFGGFIEGFGEWRLEPLGPDTRVIYQLEVNAYGWLVALLGKVFDLAQLHSRSMQTILHNLSDVLQRKQHSNG